MQLNMGRTARWVWYRIWSSIADCVIQIKLSSEVSLSFGQKEVHQKHKLSSDGGHCIGEQQ